MTKQKPITEGMTPEQLKKYNAEVREARYGNAPNMWNVWPVSGLNLKVETKPLSDNLGYGCFDKEEFKKTKQDQEVLAARQNKSKQIEKWEQSIEKLTAQIERIKSDSTLLPREKISKIESRQRIIDNYKQDIAQALEYIEYQKAKSQELFGKNNQKTK